MSQRVRDVLSWYGSDNPGTLTNLARVLNHGKLAGTGRMVILPVDQGFEHGPARSCHGTRSTSSGATSGTCRPIIRTAITAWHACSC